MNKGIIFVATVALAASTIPTSSASASQPYELPSVMTITKSSNKNEVRYAAKVDERCVPASKAPMRPYWQMRERGPDATEPLTSRERSVLGIERQEVSGDEIHFVVSGLRSRAFVAHVAPREDGRGCTSWVDTTIGGDRARVASIHVKQTFFGGVDYVELTGRTTEGKTVNERMHP